MHDLENVGKCHDVQHSRGAMRWQIPDFPSDGSSNVFNFSRFSCEILRLTLRLKNLGQGTKYSNLNGLIRWQISISIKLILEHFCWLFQFSRCFHFKIWCILSLTVCFEIIGFGIFPENVLGSFLDLLVFYRLFDNFVCGKWYDSIKFDFFLNNWDILVFSWVIYNRLFQKGAAVKRYNWL